MLFGTMETWLIWNLTGGADGGLHITDATNASRTMLMKIPASTWDEELLEFSGSAAAEILVLGRGLRGCPLGPPGCPHHGSPR